MRRATAILALVDPAARRAPIASKTPLLLITGHQDHNVPERTTSAMFDALRRLGRWVEWVSDVNGGRGMPTTNEAEVRDFDSRILGWYGRLPERSAEAGEGQAERAVGRIRLHATRYGIPASRTGVITPAMFRWRSNWLNAATSRLRNWSNWPRYARICSLSRSCT